MITEDQLEQLAIQWFQDTGGENIEHRTLNMERRSDEKRILAAEREALRTLTPALSQGEKGEDGRLAEVVQRLNPKLPESAVEEVVHVVTKPEHPLLVQSNRTFHQLLNDRRHNKMY